MRGIAIALSFVVAGCCTPQLASAAVITVPDTALASAGGAMIPAFFGKLTKKVKSSVKSFARKPVM